MIQKEAFILGADSFCKTAGITGADRDAFVQLVADGDEAAVERVRASMAKSAEDDKKPEKKTKDVAPADTEGKSEVKPKPEKPKLSRAALARRVRMLTEGDITAGGGERFSDLAALLPQLSEHKDLSKQVYSAIGSPRWEMEKEYDTWSPGGVGRWLSDDWQRQVPAGGKRIPQQYWEAAGDAAEAARQAGDFDKFREIHTSMLMHSGNFDEETAFREAQKMTQQARKQSLTEQEAAEVAAGQTPAPGAPAAPAAPAAALTPEQKQQAQAAAERYAGSPVPTSEAGRAAWLPEMQKAIAGTEDGDLQAQLAAKVRSAGLTNAERAQYAPLMQQMEQAAAKRGDFETLAGLKQDAYMASHGFDTANKDSWDGQMYKDTMADAEKQVASEVEPLAATWQPPKEEAAAPGETPAEAAAKAEGADDGRKPLSTMNLENLQQMWASNDPSVAYLKEQGITADQYYESNRSATQQRQSRAQLSTLQNRMGTDFSYKDLAAMSNEDILNRAGGDQGTAARYTMMKQLAQKLYRESKGQLPAAAGSPSGEQAVSQGTAPEQAASMIERTPTGLAMERMKMQDEGGVVQRGEGGGLAATSSTGGYMRGAMEGQEMPSMQDIATLRGGGQIGAQPAPAEQAIAAEPEPAVGAEPTAAEAAAAQAADPMAQKAETRGAELAAEMGVGTPAQQPQEAAVAAGPAGRAESLAQKQPYAPTAPPAGTTPQEIATAERARVRPAGMQPPPQTMTAGGTQHPYAAQSQQRLQAFQQSPMMQNLRAESAIRTGAKSPASKPQIGVDAPKPKPLA